jgi:hypothetical protein
MAGGGGPLHVIALVLLPALFGPTGGDKNLALAIGEAILRRLGATPEQIDRERSRAHGELFGESAA